MEPTPVSTFSTLFGNNFGTLIVSPQQMIQKRLVNYYSIKALYYILAEEVFPEDSSFEERSRYDVLVHFTPEERKTQYTDCIKELFNYVQAFKTDPGVVHAFISFFQFNDLVQDHVLEDALRSYRIKNDGNLVDTRNYSERTSKSSGIDAVKSSMDLSKFRLFLVHGTVDDVDVKPFTVDSQKVLHLLRIFQRVSSAFEETN
jgi:hypothetical protein